MSTVELEAIESPIRTEDLRRRFEETLRQVETASQESLEHLYETVVRAVRRLFIDSDHAVLYTLNKGYRPEIRYVNENIVSDPRELVNAMKPIRPGFGLGDWMVEHGELFVEDVRTHPPLVAAGGMRALSNAFILRQHILAFIGIRLGDAESPTGILYINWLRPRNFSQTEIQMLRLFTGRVTRLIRERRQQEQYTLSTIENQRFEHLLSSLREQKTQIDLSAEIAEVLTQANEEVRNVRIVLRMPRSQLHEYVLDENGTLQQQVLNADPERKKEAGFVKQMIHLFQSTTSDQDREYFAWRNGLAQEEPKGYIVAANVRVGDNCVAVVFTEVKILQPFEGHFRQTPIILRYGNILARYAKRLAVVIRHHDTTRTLVSLRELTTNLAENYELSEIALRVAAEIAQNLRLVDAITVYYRDDLSDQILNAQFGVNDPTALDQFPPYDDDGILPLLEAEEPVVGEKSLTNNPFCRSEGFVTSAAFPLRGSGGEHDPRNIGVMFFNYRILYHFDDEERNVLRLYSENAMIALNRALQHRAAERERRHLRIMQKFALAIRSLNPDSVIRTILETIQHEFQGVAHNFALVEYDAHKNQLLIGPVSLNGFYNVDARSAVGVFAADASKDLGLAGQIILHGEEGKARIYHHIKTQKPAGYIEAIKSTNSQICVKVSNTAALVVESDFPAPFNEKEHVKLLELIADYAAIALQKAHEHEQLQHVKEQKWREEIAVLASGLVHDIRGIVGVIPAAVNEMRMMSSDFAITFSQQIASINSALEKTQRINTRLEDFLKNRKFSPESVALHDLINGALNLAQEYYNDTIEVTVGTRGMRTKLHVDKVWIELLLKNILQNAYRAIIRKGRPGKVKIRVSRDQDHCYIHVQDTGVGIPQDKYEEIFKLLYTDDKQDASMLHGIGLYYSRELARTHKGDLYVEKSTVGRGTTMCLKLPIRARFYQDSIEQAN